MEHKELQARLRKIYDQACKGRRELERVENMTIQLAQDLTESVREKERQKED